MGPRSWLLLGAGFFLLQGVILVQSQDEHETVTDFLPFGPAHGDSTVPTLDDGSTGGIQLGTDIGIFGSHQNRLYVNTNGVLSLGQSFARASSGGSDFSSVSSPPIIAPFWDDIDVTKGGDIYYRQDFSLSIADQVQREIHRQYPDVGFFYPSLVFVATWDRVAAFDSSFSVLNNTFQVVIASDGVQTFVTFHYGDIQWGGSRTLIGVSAGDEFNFITHPASLSSSVLLLNSTSVTYQIDGNETVITPTNFLRFGPAHGDSTVPTLDDGSTGRIQLGTDIVIFGSHQNRLYVNTNGVLSLGESFTSIGSGGSNFSSVSSPPIIAPFWDDIDVTKGGNIYYRQDFSLSIADQVQREIHRQYPDVGFFHPSLVFVATWDRVAAFDSSFSGLNNTFQVVIASDGVQTFVTFHYDDIEWGGFNTLIGVSAGDGFNFITHPASLSSSVLLLNSTSVTYQIDGNETVTIPTDFLPFGPAHGDSTVPIMDDGSTGGIQLGTDIVIFGSHQNRLYVNTNGVLSLRQSFSTRTSSGGSNFNSVFSPPIIAPFWDDIDVTRRGVIYYRQDFSLSIADQVQLEIYRQYPEVGFFYPSLVFIATWDRVAAYSFSGFSGLVNTFQVIIASDGGRTFVRFIYDDIQWGGFNTLIGVSAGDGFNFITHPASLSSSILLLDSTSVTYRIDGPGAVTSCQEFDLQLMNTMLTYTQGLYQIVEGNVEVCINGTYVAICDLGWDNVEAQLTCNAVGYTEPYYRGFAVDGLVATTSIGIENVMCPSNSTSTSDCSGDIPPESPRCLNNFSAAGVRCIQERAPCFLDGDFSVLNITYDNYLGQFNGGDFSFTAKVAVCQNGVRGSVCDVNWDQDDATVFCNTIATLEKYEATPLYGFDVGVDPIVLESVNCTGDEVNISSCSLSPIGTITNSVCQEPNRAAGVRCSLVPGSCINGRGRLVDGPTFYEGRLEVCVDNQWQTVCEEGFDVAAATSACRDRILLTGSQGTAVYGNAYGFGTGPTLTACPLESVTDFVPIGSCFSNSTCSSEREVGVRCPRGQLSISAIAMGSSRLGSSFFSIQCLAQQYPWNTTLMSGGWYDVDGNPVVASSKGGPVSVDLLQNTYNSLSIILTYTFRNQLNFDHPLSISDGGYYSCNVSVELHYPDNSIAKLSNSTVYPLIIEVPPPTVLISSEDSPIHNRPYTATCFASFEAAVPLDMVEMELRTLDGDILTGVNDRVQVSLIRQINDSTFARDITVNPLTVEDNGTYVCDAEVVGEFIISSSMNESIEISVIVLAPSPEVQGLCSIVVWYSPEVSCEGIIGYDVRLYNPQSPHQNVMRRVGANGTFYIIKDEDKLAGSDETYVQVRVIHNMYSREGEWSKEISLGCEKPTVPEEPPRVYFMLHGKVYHNNSAVPLTEIREGDDALHCKTDKEECCGTVPNRFGEFYYPNGVRVPIARQQEGFYRNRGEQIIRLNRREGITSPTGMYRCEIPNADDVMVKIYITLTAN